METLLCNVGWIKRRAETIEYWLNLKCVYFRYLWYADGWTDILFTPTKKEEKVMQVTITQKML